MRARANLTGCQISSLDGRPRPDHGPGWRDRVCSDCGASWVGHERDGDEWCPWCERALARQVADQRRLLLDPPWLRTSAGDPRYDDLSAVDRQVWDRTRNPVGGADSMQAWAERLARAVTSGLVTESEARVALARAQTRRSA